MPESHYIDAARDFMTSAMRMAPAKSGNVLEAVLSLVHFPDGAIVQVKMGNYAPIDGLVNAVMVRQATAPETMKEGLQIYQSIRSIEEGCETFARCMANVAGKCNMCHTVQSAYVELHQVVVELQNGVHMPPTNDRGVSRRHPDGSVFQAAKIPFELWRRVAEYLAPRDLFILPAVVRPVFDNRDDIVWGTLFERSFALPEVPLESWRDGFLFRIRYYGIFRGVPTLDRYLRNDCPYGSVCLGTEVFQLVDYHPTVIGIQQRRGRHSTLRLEAAVVPVAALQGSVTVVTVLSRLEDSEVRIGRTQPFVNSELSSGLRTHLLEVNAAVLREKARA